MKTLSKPSSVVLPRKRIQLDPHAGLRYHDGRTANIKDANKRKLFASEYSFTTIVEVAADSLGNPIIIPILHRYRKCTAIRAGLVVDVPTNFEREKKSIFTVLDDCSACCERHRAELQHDIDNCNHVNVGAEGKRVCPGCHSDLTSLPSGYYSLWDL